MIKCTENYPYNKMCLGIGSYSIKKKNPYLLGLYQLGFSDTWLSLVCSTREDLHLLLLSAWSHHLPRNNLNKILNLRFSRICK